MNSDRTALYDIIRRGAERLSTKEVYAVADALFADLDKTLRSLGGEYRETDCTVQDGKWVNTFDIYHFPAFGED